MPMTNRDLFKLLPQVVYGMFGVTATLAPYIFWESSAIVPVIMTFWKGAVDSPATIWWARAFGTGMLTYALGPSFGVGEEGYFKQTLIFNLFSAIHFVMMILMTDGIVVEWMWWSYVPLFLFFACGSAYYLKVGSKTQMF